MDVLVRGGGVISRVDSCPGQGVMWSMSSGVLLMVTVRIFYSGCIVAIEEVILWMPLFHLASLPIIDKLEFTGRNLDSKIERWITMSTSSLFLIVGFFFVHYSKPSCVH